MPLLSMAATAATSPETTGGLVGWVTSVMEALGGPGAGLLVALENLFPPIPSEVILPLAGFTASQGDFSLVGAIVWTTLGSLIGATVLYYLGALVGRERIRWIADKLPLVNVADFDKTEAWFGKHGTKAILIGRLIPIFRSLISIPAGIERMPLPIFLALTGVGSLVWNSALIFAGYGLGENWHVVEKYIGYFQWGVIVVCVAAVAYFVVSRLRRRKAEAGKHSG
jgi:membrane protein DedA with SNARE-associated domain